MPEYRDCQIMCNLEPTIMAEVQVVLREEDITASNYVRALVIKDLTARNLLTTEKLVAMATTDSTKQMKRRIERITGTGAQASAAS